MAWSQNGQCAIIDAGCSDERERDALDSFIASKGLQPVVAVNTHGHFDHSLGVEYVKQRYGIPFALHSSDKRVLETMSETCGAFGIDILGQTPSIDIDLSSIDTIAIGDEKLQVIHTPGHTPGHIALYNADSQILFSGDTLFYESIGRTDLPGGDYQAIMESILHKLLPLGHDTRILPGHGGESTIGHESVCNPFITEVINAEVNPIS